MVDLGGVSSAKTRSSWMLTMPPPAARPGCAGTRSVAGSGPTPSPTSPWPTLETSRPGRPSWPTPARPAQQPRGAPADHSPLRPARTAVLRVLRAPDARASTATRFPITCAARACPVDLRGHVGHPGNVYLREADLLPAIDG